MTFIQGESSRRQSARFHVGPQTFMVMCHYQVSLVLISGVFPPDTERERERQRKKKRQWENEVLLGEQSGLGWGQRRLR